MDLPDELLAEIAARLPLSDAVGLRRVCRRLRDVVPHLLQPLQPPLYVLEDKDVKWLAPAELGAMGELGALWSRLGAVGLAVRIGDQADMAGMLQKETLAELGVRVEHLRRVRIQSTLRTLRLSASALFRAVLSCEQLVHVEANCCNFDWSDLAEGLEAHGHPGLLRLTLTSCHLDRAGGLALAQALERSSSSVCPRLLQLELADNMIGNEGVRALVKALQGHRSVVAVNLCHNDIGHGLADEALSQALGEGAGIRSLDLSRNGLGDDEAEVIAQALATNSTLTDLQLNSTVITDAGARVLAAALETNTSLKHLSLCGNTPDEEYALFVKYVGDAGAAALAKALEANQTMTSLCLRHQNIGQAGAAALKTALKANSTLTHIDLCGNPLGEGGFALLVGGLSANRAITHINLSQTEAAEAAGKLARVLRMQGPGGLAFVGLGGNRINDAGAEALAEGLANNTTVRVMDLSGNAIGDVGASALGKALASNSVLVRLDLSENNIDEGGAVAIARGAEANPGPALSRINLTSNPFRNEGMAACNACPLIHLFQSQGSVGSPEH